MGSGADIALIEAAKQAWGASVAADLKSQMSLMGLRDTGKLLRLMGVQFRMFSGSIEGVSFKTNRVGMIKLNGIREQLVSTKAGTSYRLRRKDPQDWLNPVLRSRVPELSELLAELHANAVINESSIINFDSRKDK